MALPTNDDFANCELSAEELEAIAAGGLGSLIHAGINVYKAIHQFEHEVVSFFGNPVVAIVGGGLVGFGLPEPGGVKLV